MENSNELGRKLIEMKGLVECTQFKVKSVNEELLVRQEQVIKLQRSLLQTDMQDEGLVKEYRRVMDSYGELRQANDELLTSHNNLLVHYGQVLRMYFESIETSNSGKISENEVISRQGINIPITKVSKSQECLKTVCSICYEDLDKSESKSAFVDCTHWYHLGCICHWVITTEKCPQCQYKITEIFST